MFNKEEFAEELELAIPILEKRLDYQINQQKLVKYILNLPYVSNEMYQVGKHQPPEYNLNLIYPILIQGVLEINKNYFNEKLSKRYKEAVENYQQEVKKRLGIEFKADSKLELSDLRTLNGAFATYDHKKNIIKISLESLILKEITQENLQKILFHEMTHALTKQIFPKGFDYPKQSKLSKYDTDLQSNHYNFEGFAEWFGYTGFLKKENPIKSPEELVEKLKNTTNQESVLDNLTQDNYTFGHLTYELTYRAFGKKAVLKMITSYLPVNKMIKKFNKAAKKLKIKIPKIPYQKVRTDLTRLYREISNNPKEIILKHLKATEKGIKKALKNKKQPEIWLMEYYMDQDLLKTIHRSGLNYQYKGKQNLPNIRGNIIRKSDYSYTDEANIILSFQEKKTIFKNATHTYIEVSNKDKRSEPNSPLWRSLLKRFDQMSSLF